MGCELSWNSAETSWDCPCHGSRFSYEGDIIEGPAVKPLDINNDVNTIEKLTKDDF
jgi:Rieske Fe-S protein